MGAAVMVSKMIARRRTTDEEFAPQSQLVYGMFFILIKREYSLIHRHGRRFLDYYSSCQAREV
jgi:hypothetical protein